jgi:hypothetical protein
MRTLNTTEIRERYGVLRKQELILLLASGCIPQHYFDSEILQMRRDVADVSFIPPDIDEVVVADGIPMRVCPCHFHVSYSVKQPQKHLIGPVRVAPKPSTMAMPPPPPRVMPPAPAAPAKKRSADGDGDGPAKKTRS